MATNLLQFQYAAVLQQCSGKLSKMLPVDSILPWLSSVKNFRTSVSKHSNLSHQMAITRDRGPVSCQIVCSNLQICERTTGRYVSSDLQKFVQSDTSYFRLSLLCYRRHSK